MSVVIREAFTVKAPVDRVFAFLNNPAEVVTCLPGAELTETIDQRTYAGRVRVKVGPITAAYAGRATLTDVDPAAGRVAIDGEGKESGGSGSARMKLAATATANTAGGTDVTVDATIDIAGRVMQYGRGLIESVSKQLFQQFVEQARTRLEALAAEAPGGASAQQSGVATSPSGAPAPQRELRALPLLLRALLHWIAGLFRRG